MISKCVESFPDEEERDVVTWLFVLKSMPKQIRTQLVYDCRASSLDELSTSLRRYASNVSTAKKGHSENNYFIKHLVKKKYLKRKQT